VSGLNIKELAAKRSGARPPKNTGGGWSLAELLQKDIKLFSVKFTDKHKEAFYLELSTLLTSGLDIKSALELIEEEQVKAEHAALIRKIKEDLINGDALWEAMQKAKFFTPYEYFSVQIGEETGKIGIVLDQLYSYYNSKLKQRRQFIGALSYPIIILLTSVGAVTFMLLFIVPMFDGIFRRFGGELPYLTRIIISISGVIKSYFLIFTAIIAGSSFYLYKNRDTVWFRKYSVAVVKRIPVIGNIIYSIQLARFSSSMALLLGAKVPIIRSIDLIRQMVNFYPLEVTFTEIANGVMNGKSLHETMAQFPVYNRRMVSLVKVGEEVNKLDVFFDKMAKQFSSDVDHQTGLLNTFLEPAMIIFLGFVVGFILLAMYLPMFQMSTSIGG